MGKPIYYLAHDPLSNTEAMLTEYDSDVISKAAASGIVFIAVDVSGNRTIVRPEDISEPEDDSKNFTIVQPLYVNDRMKAVVDVFDALTASVPAVAASADVQPASDGARSAASFTEALEALRALVYGTGKEGGK